MSFGRLLRSTGEHYTLLIYKVNEYFCFMGYFDLLEIVMIRCHLSRLMGERKIKIADLSRETGINRGTATRLYYETAERVEMNVISSLCNYFNCTVSDLLEYVPDQPVRPEAKHRKKT